MSADATARALERAGPPLLGGEGVENALARREAGFPAPDDAELLRSRLATIAAAQQADGSWQGEGGPLAATARALLELSELEDALASPPQDTGWGESAPASSPPTWGEVFGPRPWPGADGQLPGCVPAALRWLRGRRGAAGRYGEECDAGRHELGLCHHFLAAFHAPRCGAREAPDADGRLTDAALALRAALCWGTAGTDVALHLDGLRRVVSVWAWPDLVRVPPPRLAPTLARQGARAGRRERRRQRREQEAQALSTRVLRLAALPSPRAAVTALGAVLQAPMTSANVACAAEGIACLVRSQRADGTWHGVPLFEALETLLFAVARGYHADEVDAVLARAAALLALTQKEDGGWGMEEGASARQPLVAWRVLRHAVPSRAAEVVLEVTPV